MSWIEDTLQSNGTLINKLNIKDADKLFELESRISQLKYRSLVLHPIIITDMNSLKLIHRELFSDVYTWAGEYRPGNFHKNATEFFPVERFEFAISDLNFQVEHINQQNYHSQSALIQDLAKLLLDINNFHPFREGNGRSQRLFITLLAKQKRIELHLQKNDPAYDSYMQAAIADNTEMMVTALQKSIQA